MSGKSFFSLAFLKLVNNFIHSKSSLQLLRHIRGYTDTV